MSHGLGAECRRRTYIHTRCCSFITVFCKLPRCAVCHRFCGLTRPRKIFRKRTFVVGWIWIHPPPHSSRRRFCYYLRFAPTAALHRLVDANFVEQIISPPHNECGCSEKYSSSTYVVSRLCSFSTRLCECTPVHTPHT